ncbi:hypothetical protein BDV97DRAFT_372998 [Delphinella strobiligena]|nr:hypothetical protein BDV97DRAFT_372998 [Delphinella strobiligena]
MNKIEPSLAATVPLPRPGQVEAIVDSTTQDAPACFNRGTSQDSLAPSDQASQSSRSTSRDHGRSSAREESRRAARRRSMDMVAGAHGDVRAFVEELEQKRKQLDEQIHKFVAQKEREFKRYEQETRRKYQTSRIERLSQEDTPPVAEAQTTAEDKEVHEPQIARASGESSRSVAHPENLRSRIGRKSANSGLEDVRPSSEREKDFMGLFTPSFLPMLDGKPELNRSPSAPLLVDNHASSHSRSAPVLERANTEPILDADGNARPKYGQRISSSGSEGLVSALKSSGGRKHPKPMRVMLQLADDQPAVHPNDDLPTERGYAPVRQAEAMHHSKSGRPRPEDNSPLQSPSSTSPQSPATRPTIESPIVQSRSSLTQGLALRPINAPAVSTLTPQLGNTKHDPDDLVSPFPLDEEVTEPLRSEPEWEVDFEENIGQSSEANHTSPLAGSPETQRSSPSLSPASQIPRSLDTPIMNIRSSSSSSTQPISPGFSRPSVREDPKFDALESNEEPDDTVGQGSFYEAFSRSSVSSKNTMTGSLGESYMQRNAEEMMRRRRS